MRVELGQRVESSDGQSLGTIKHVVLDPQTNDVKSVVVEKGFWLTSDMEIPLDSVESVEGDLVRVRYTAQQAKDLPAFDPDEYRELPREFADRFGYPTGRVLWPAAMFPFPSNVSTPSLYPVPAAVPTITQPDPVAAEVAERHGELARENAVIEEGDDVLSADGKKVGEVHRIEFDSVTGRPIQLDVRQGWIFGRDVNLPGELVASIEDGVVTLTESAANLPQWERKGTNLAA